MDWNDKLKQLRTWFSNCPDEKSKYQVLLELGKKLPKISKEPRQAPQKVEGCQSLMFLSSDIRDGKIYYEAESDALISAGLAYIMTYMFSGELLETVIKSKLDFLKDLGVIDSLSPSRSNGLASLHLTIKQQAIQAIMKHNLSS
ncbi:MAG: SufE family protein [Chlamydiales bacterium]|nr:SufE family protein [Chlamydiales bacterium]NCF71091.1 SufE family protein [Chlamydiales bacterium]